MSAAKAAESVLGHDLFTIRDGKVYLDKMDAVVSSKIQEQIDALAEEFALPMQTQEEAVDALLEWASDILAKIKGPVLDEEELLWAEKSQSAVAYLAGTASAEQTADIEDEAALTGEYPKTLAAKIVGKAQAYRPIIRMTTGLRRSTIAALELVDTPQQRIDILEKAKSEASKKLTEMGIKL